MKLSITLEQYVGNLLTNCLSVFDRLLELALKGLRNITKLYNTENFDIISGHFLGAKIYFCRGDWTLGCVLKEFWDFVNISLFPKIVSLNSLGNSYTRFLLCTRYQVPFYVRWMERVLKLCKIPSYYMKRIFKKFFFCCLHFLKIETSEHNTTLTQITSTYQKRLHQ